MCAFSQFVSRFVECFECLLHESVPFSHTPASGGVTGMRSPVRPRLQANLSEPVSRHRLNRAILGKS